MDVLQSNTNHSLQAELRERTEQYNQLWLGCQRQFAEMERLHMHTIQQLQLELADARERSGIYSDESRISQTNSKDVSQFGQSNGNQLDANGGGGTSGGNSGVLPNGNSDNVSSFASTGNAPAQVTFLSLPWNIYGIIYPIPRMLGPNTQFISAFQFVDSDFGIVIG
nr:hypothetical protein CFP56_42501 [Quercus suber]